MKEPLCGSTKLTKTRGAFAKTYVPKIHPNVSFATNNYSQTLNNKNVFSYFSSETYFVET